MSDKGQRIPAALQPGSRGWVGASRGIAGHVSPVPFWRGTTVQVCGMWPWIVGAGSPVIGVPVGHHLFTGATVCADPISWFAQAGLISTPSQFVLGLPGLGKSTQVRRIVTGLAAFGIQPLILGDLKPDYVDLIEALGGQVIRLGRGRGYLNILDPGDARDAASLLDQHGLKREAKVLREDAHARSLAMVETLVTIMRRHPPTDREVTILDRALKVLAQDQLDVPVLTDLLRIIQAAPEPVRAVALDRGDDRRYAVIVEELEATLIGLITGGRLGEVFSRPTTNPMRRDAPVVFDISSIPETDKDLCGAALMACWSAGFATITAAHALAEAGLEPERHYLAVMDEMWRALNSGSGMVDRFNALTRLNRQWGVGQIMVTHTMRDLEALANEDDRKKAIGLVERSGMVVLGGLPQSEMELLTQAIPLSQEEQRLLVSWQDPGPVDIATGKASAPPGRGNFLVKIGGRPGVPFHVDLTEQELQVNDTNKRWREEMG